VPPTPTNPPVPFGDPAVVIDVGEELLSRAKGVAEGIATRVRHALDPEWPVAASPQPPPAARSLRVLCVDDVPDAADALAAVLVLLGCDARVCYDGPSAVRVAAEFAPDVCVLDLSMPGMDGIQLAARLRVGAGSRPFFLVAATALGAVEERTLTALAGFHFHLVKPVAGDDLVRAIDAIRAATPRPGRNL
jgi:CheY-like chemotaxis protein